MKRLIGWRSSKLPANRARLGGMRIVLTAFLGMATAGAALKPDESVTLFPALAWATDDGWRLDLQGVVTEPAVHPGQAAVFEKLLGIDRDEYTEAERRLFRSRIEWFLVDNERGKNLILDLLGQELRAGTSGANGHFSGELGIDRTVAGGHGVPAKGGGVEVSVAVRASSGPARKVTVPVHFVPDDGWSVVSDIDDTIKVSHVRDTKAMIRATFCRPFEAVPGMADRYREWTNAAGVGPLAFHYVSASPWQLYPALSEFISSNGFPAGTFHLKTVRLKDTSILRLFGEQTGYKVKTIEALLTRFPRRRFVFVGDSGEQDPEIYGGLARRYSGQVRQVWIRNVTGEDASAPRYRSAFREVDAAVWSVFDDPKSLPNPARW